MLTTDSGMGIIRHVDAGYARWRVSRLDLTTNVTRELVRGGNPYRPRLAPDGSWMVYVGDSGQKRVLWRMPSEGGTPQKLNDRMSNWPAISPDGNWIAYHDREQEPPTLALMPADGGPPAKLFKYPGTVEPRAADIRWTPDGRAITYILTRNGVSNLWNQPVEGGAPKQITDFDKERIYRFDWSPNGKLVLARGADQNDVVQITGLK